MWNLQQSACRAAVAAFTTCTGGSHTAVHVGWDRISTALEPAVNPGPVTFPRKGATAGAAVVGLRVPTVRVRGCLGERGCPCVCWEAGNGKGLGTRQVWFPSHHRFPGAASSMVLNLL